MMNIVHITLESFQERPLLTEGQMKWLEEHKELLWQWLDDNEFENVDWETSEMKILTGYDSVMTYFFYLYLYQNEYYNNSSKLDFIAEKFIKQRGQIMFVQGSPGAGKTLFMFSLAKKLHNEYGEKIAWLGMPTTLPPFVKYSTFNQHNLPENCTVLCDEACLSLNTKIITEKGIKKLSEITNKDKLLSLNVYSNTLEYQSIIVSQPIKKHVYEIEMENGEIIKCSGEHRWFSAQKLQDLDIGHSIFQGLKKTEELKKGNFLLKLANARNAKNNSILTQKSILKTQKESNTIKKFIAQKNANIWHGKNSKSLHHNTKESTKKYYSADNATKNFMSCNQKDLKQRTTAQNPAQIKEELDYAHGIKEKNSQNIMINLAKDNYNYGETKNTQKPCSKKSILENLMDAKQKHLKYSKISNQNGNLSEMENSSSKENAPTFIIKKQTKSLNYSEMHGMKRMKKIQEKNFLKKEDTEHLFYGQMEASQIKSIKKKSESSLMKDIEVKNNHNFFLKNGIMSHNSVLMFSREATTEEQKNIMKRIPIRRHAGRNFIVVSQLESLTDINWVRQASSLVFLSKAFIPIAKQRLILNKYINYFMPLKLGECLYFDNEAIYTFSFEKPDWWREIYSKPFASFKSTTEKNRTIANMLHDKLNNEMIRELCSLRGVELSAAEIEYARRLNQSLNLLSLKDNALNDLLERGFTDTPANDYLDKKKAYMKCNFIQRPVEKIYWEELFKKDENALVNSMINANQILLEEISNASKWGNIICSIYGGTGTGKSHASISLADAMCRIFGKRFNPEMICFMPEEIIEKTKTAKQGDCIVMDEQKKTWGTGSGIDKMKMQNIEEMLRKLQINFIFNSPELHPHQHHFILRTFGIDEKQKIAKLMLYTSDKNLVGYVTLRQPPTETLKKYEAKKDAFLSETKEDKESSKFERMAEEIMADPTYALCGNRSEKLRLITKKFNVNNPTAESVLAEIGLTEKAKTGHELNQWEKHRKKQKEKIIRIPR